MNFLQRMPQSTKVLLAGLLLVGGVATWYLALFRPNQTAQPPTPTEIPATTARPLEVLPLPFLVTEAPKPGTQANQGTKTTTVAASRPRVTVPPNPFVPLVVETAAATPTSTPPITAPTASLPTATARPTSNPIPTQTARVQVRQPTAALPSSTLTNTIRPNPTNTAGITGTSPKVQPRLAASSSKAGLPGALSLGTGALPIRLTPLDKEVSPTQANTAVQPAVQTTEGTASTPLDFAKAELDAKVGQTLEPKSSAPTPKPTDTVQVSNLAKYIRDQSLKLAGVVLGPTSVGIFQSKDGFVVLPVGRTLPGSDVLLKSLSAKEALLVQGSESLNLEIQTP